MSTAGSSGKYDNTTTASRSFNRVELSTDAEEVVELKAKVAQLQEQLDAKDKSIEVHIHIKSYIPYCICSTLCTD